MPAFMMILLMFVSILLILVILLQRGRGGGLVGALSGLGGQSAFGTKAGDMFTRITIGIAAVWVLLAGIAGHVLREHTKKFEGTPPEIKSLTKDTGAGATSTIDNSKEAGTNGSGLKEGTKADGDPKSPAKKESEGDKANKTVPVKDGDPAEKPGDSK